MSDIDKDVLFRKLFDSSPDCLKLLNADGTILDINSAGAEMTQTSREALIGTPVYQLVCPEYRRSYYQLIREAKPGKLNSMELEVCDQDGSRRWMDARLAPLIGRSSQVRLLVGITRDIHETKLAQRRAERLARQLLTSQDNERKAIAQELHDDISQALLAIQFNAEFIVGELETDGAELRGAVQQVRKLSKEIADSIFSLTNRLHPLTLQHLGLAQSIQELAGSWHTTQPELTVCCNLDTGFVATLNETVALALYRIVQECLCNVARHAQATKVTIELCGRAAIAGQRSAHLSVQDNGCGIDLKKMRAGRGILGMEKRVRTLGGQFTIQRNSSRQASGTTVTAVIPPEQQE